MRKILSILFVLITATAVYAGEYKQFAYPFIGRWQPAEDPLLVDDYGYQDIQNLRKDGKRLRGVKGHTVINSTPLSSTSALNAFHFKKDAPESESHVLVFMDNGSTRSVFDNEIAIPSAGDFGATAWKDSGTSTSGRFSTAPQGNVVFSDESDTVIWGGDAYSVGAFISGTAISSLGVITEARDDTDKVTGNQNDYATIGFNRDEFIIGSTRILTGINIEFESTTISGETITGQFWNGSGSDWDPLTLTDGTNGLSQSGSITWTATSTGSDGRPVDDIRYIEGYSLYWYRFVVSAMGADDDGHISKITAIQDPQEIHNIWDGSLVYPAKVLVYNGATYNDYTDEALSDAYTVPLDSQANGNYIYFGFIDRMQAISLSVEFGNSNAATLSGQLSIADHDGSNAWSAMNDLLDGTAAGGKTFSNSGSLVWSIKDNTSFSREAPMSFPDGSGSFPLYWYRFTPSAALDAEVEIKTIRGVPYFPSIPPYEFSKEFQSRLFLFSEKNGSKNKVIYSAYNSPDVFNGADSGEFLIGDGTKIVAAETLFNIYKTSGYDQLIIAKEHQTYRLTGYDADTYKIEQISGSTGCSAPLSMASCEVSEVEDGTFRQVLIWQAANGVYLCDGAAVEKISDDIAMYWDDTDPRAIPKDRMDDSYGWYDTNLGAYKLLISSGAGQTTHNVELEYSLKNKEWTKIYRENGSGANPLQVGVEVRDTNTNRYSYGLDNNGIMYRTENGTTWNGTSIEEYVQTKDLLLDSETPFMTRNFIEYIRLAFEDKDTSTESITTTHYCDGELTVSGTNNQVVFTDESMAGTDYRTQAVYLGPCFKHSLKFYTDVSTVDNGLELLGLGLYYKNEDRIFLQ